MGSRERNVRDGKEERGGKIIYILIKILKLIYHSSVTPGISDS